MKKLLVLVLILFYTTVSGQILETIGAGVVDFLLSSPSTANKMNTDQQIALSLVGGLLNKAGNRKHDLNVAEAGQTQITLNTDSGQQIQLAMDTNGSVFAISNGIIYPIGQNVVSQAKEYVLNQQPGYMDYVKNNSNLDHKLMLPDFDHFTLKSKWDINIPSEVIEAKYHKNATVSDIVNKYNIRKNQLFFYKLGGQPLFLVDCESCKKMLEDKRKFDWKWDGSQQAKLFSGMGISGFTLRGGFLMIANIKHTPRGMFTAGWFIDSNGNHDAEFSEYQDIRRNFYSDESFVIACGLYNNHNYYAELKIYDQASGKLIHRKKYPKTYPGAAEINMSFIKQSFNPGIYTYTVFLKRVFTQHLLETFSDKFQILSSENVKTEISKRPLSSNTSSSKDDSISELIQLLKEGKISEETFKISMEALEAN